MIKTIIFDWGGVLIDQPLEEVIKYCAKVLGVELKLLKTIFSEETDIFIEFQKGTILENTLWKEICDKLNINEPKSDSLWKEAVNNVFLDKKDMYQLLRDLRKNGYKIGFLSNTEIPTMEYFYENKYDKYFDAIVFSCAEKIVKPDSKIYNIILDKLKDKPEEVVFIDDYIENIEGAIQAGI
jgi:putative hydrolase of the HAD superfamily